MASPDLENRPSLRQAAEALRQVEAFEDGLRRRTEGTTWMVWALVFAGISVTYGVTEVLVPPNEADPSLWPWLLPWLPWVLAGGLATRAIWRSAQLHAPGLAARPWWLNLAAMAGVTVGMWALFVASWFLPQAAQAFVTPPVLMGAAAAAVVASGLLRLTATGRRAALAACGAQVALGMALGAASLPATWTFAWTALVLGGTWLAAGLWETAQG